VTRFFLEVARSIELFLLFPIRTQGSNSDRSLHWSLEFDLPQAQAPGVLEVKVQMVRSWERSFNTQPAIIQATRMISERLVAAYPDENCFRDLIARRASLGSDSSRARKSWLESLAGCWTWELLKEGIAPFHMSYKPQQDGHAARRVWIRQESLKHIPLPAVRSCDYHFPFLFEKPVQHSPSRSVGFSVLVLQDLAGKAEQLWAIERRL
jgi:hypothetical protein